MDGGQKSPKNDDVFYEQPQNQTFLSKYPISSFSKKPIFQPLKFLKSLFPEFFVASCTKLWLLRSNGTKICQDSYFCWLPSQFMDFSSQIDLQGLPKEKKEERSREHLKAFFHATMLIYQKRKQNGAQEHRSSSKLCNRPILILSCYTSLVYIY